MSEEPKPWKYKPLRSWVCWDRFWIGRPGDIYLDRICLIRTPFFQILLHRIYRPDRQDEMHDHPWDFLSILLRGFYIEDTPKGLKYRRWFNWKWATDRHSIRTVSRVPVWSLVFTGPKRKSWGFWVDGGTRWVHWKKYENLYGA